MTDPILNLYEWALGSCFRCARTDLPTTRIAEIDTPQSGTHEIRACKPCVLELEAERDRYAERTGTQYIPGQLGSPP